MRTARELAAGLIALGLVLPLAPVDAGERSRFGAVVGPVRIVARGPVSVAGMHSYDGRLEIGSPGDGLLLTNTLGLERYLLGLNEVPTDWPFEALKAQAVAARTYAVHTLEQGRAGEAAVYGFDICATVSCQVYSGADVTRSSTGARWVQAVEQTAGEILTYQGRAILARYHSTSGGQTLDNPQAFPDEPGYPYLRAVPSTDEQGSPLYRWTTSFSLRRVQVMLERAGWWGAGRLRSVQTDGAPFDPGLTMTFRGARSAATRTADDFRDLVRDMAPALWPRDYPGPAATASGRLPETLPSHRITVWTDRKGVVHVLGRGWGHGVGMSQWGAHGMALNGARYRDILGHYYTGVSTGHAPDRPVEVGLAWGLPSVTVTGSFSIFDGRGRRLVDDALGTWRFTPAGPGAIAVDPPEGFGLPLRVGIIDAPRRAVTNGSALLTIAISRPARIKVVTRSPGGDAETTGFEVRETGRTRMAWAAPARPGRYEVTIVGSSGKAVRRSEPVEIVVVRAPRAAPPAPPPSEPGTPLSLRSVALVVLALVLLLSLGALGALRLRTGPPR